MLGTVTASTLARQRELRDAEREHDRTKRELDARMAAAQAWEAEVESYYLQAQALGLLPNARPPEKAWSVSKYISELRQVPQLVSTMDLPDVQEGTGEAAAIALNKVVTEEDDLSQQLGAIRRRLDKIEQLSSTMSEYDLSLSGQEDRLLGVGWLEEKLMSPYECPVCAAVHESGNPRLVELQTLAREMKSLTASVHDAPAKLDEELAALRLELRSKEMLLSKARQKRKALETESLAIAMQRQKVRQIYLFVGRVEQAIENVAASQNVDDIRKTVAQLAKTIDRLKRDLDPRSQRERLQAAIDKVSGRIADYARLLHLEHAAENAKLNVRELTLQFTPLSGRTDYLWEVGSGQNWVGYHIAGLLALHEHFIGLKQNPVPRFLVLDQPSQVYFPEAWPSVDAPPSSLEAPAVSADIDGVRRIFDALSEFLKSVSAEFQIIVTEHAGSITWEGVPGVHVVANWRDGHDEFLIPAAWITRRNLPSR